MIARPWPDLEIASPFTMAANLAFERSYDAFISTGSQLPRSPKDFLDDDLIVHRAGSKMLQGEDHAIARERQRRFARARRAARALCPGLSREDVSDRDFLLPGTTLQRYRELFVVMGLACGTPGGHAIASLARHGYVIVVTMPVPHRRGTPRVMAINTPGVVWFGAGLPTTGRLWSAVERHALQLEVADYPVLQFVSGHECLRIRQQMRLEGHDVG